MAYYPIVGRLPETEMEALCPYSRECAHSNYGDGFICRDPEEFEDCCTYNQFLTEKKQCSQGVSELLIELGDHDSPPNTIDQLLDTLD